MERCRIIGMQEANFSFRQISDRIGRSVSVVHRIYRERFEKGRHSRREGSGTSSANQSIQSEDYRLQRICLADRTADHC